MRPIFLSRRARLSRVFWALLPVVMTFASVIAIGAMLALGVRP